jgi:signal transduction histidine kinase
VTQAVLNLLDNALKYTSSGRVRLSAHPSGSGDEVQMAVSHSGPGIPAEHLPHIFDRF